MGGGDIVLELGCVKYDCSLVWWAAFQMTDCPRIDVDD